MSAGYNKLIAVGNITRDAESRMVGETEVGRYSVAINGRKDKQGNTKVVFLDCDHWRIGGVLPLLTKGQQVLVEGELEQQAWEDKEGNKRSKIILNVRQLQLLGSKRARAEEPEPEMDFASF